MPRNYNKILAKPKYKLPGIFPSGSIKELGFDRSDLGNTSMGSFRIKKTKNWGYYYGMGDYHTSNVYSAIQGFPVLLDGLLLDWGRMPQNHTVISIPNLAANAVNGYGVASVGGGAGMGSLTGVLSGLDEAFSSIFCSPKLAFSYHEDPDAHLDDSAWKRQRYNNFTELFNSDWLDIRTMVDDVEDGVYDRNTGVQELGPVIENEDGDPIKNIKVELTALQQRAIWDWFNRARIWHSPTNGDNGSFDSTQVAYDKVKVMKKNTAAIFGKGEWVYSPNLSNSHNNTPSNRLGRFMGSYVNSETFAEGFTSGFDGDYGPLNYSHYNDGTGNGGMLGDTGLYDEAAGSDVETGNHKIRRYNRFRHRVTRGLTDGTMASSDWSWFPGLEFEVKLQNPHDVMITSNVALPTSMNRVYSNALVAEYFKQAMELGEVDIDDVTGKVVAQNLDFWTTVLDPNNDMNVTLRGFWYMIYSGLGGAQNIEILPNSLNQAQQIEIWNQITTDDLTPGPDGELPLWGIGDHIGFDMEAYTAPQFPTIHYDTGSIKRYRNTDGTPTSDAPSWYQNHPYFREETPVPPPAWLNEGTNEESNPTTWIKAIWLADGTRITAENHEEILYGYPGYYESENYAVLTDFNDIWHVWDGSSGYPTSPPEGCSTPTGLGVKMYSTFEETRDQGKQPVAIELAYDDQYILQQQLNEVWEGNPEEGIFEYRSIESYIRYMTMSLMENIIYNQDSHQLGKTAFMDNIAVTLFHETDDMIQIFGALGILPPGVIIGDGGENRYLLHYLQLLAGMHITNASGAFINKILPNNESGLADFLSGLDNWALTMVPPLPTGITPDPAAENLPDDIFEQERSTGVLKGVTIGMPSFVFFPQGYYNEFLGFLDYTTYARDLTAVIPLASEYKVFYNPSMDMIPYETYVEINIIEGGHTADDLEPPLYFVPDLTDDRATAYYKVSSPLEVEFAINPYEFDAWYTPLVKDSAGQIIDDQISAELTLWLNRITQYIDNWDPENLDILSWFIVPSYMAYWGDNIGDHERLTIEPHECYYMYKIIQWGDEKNLLSDDDIYNSKYFAPYVGNEGTDVGSLPPDADTLMDFIGELTPHDDALFMKHLITATPILNIDGEVVKSKHVYMRPGVYQIKAVVYRLTPDKNILVDTNLINKNIVVIDDTTPTEDFQQFGGTPFDILPIKESNEELNQVMIGGLSKESKYFNSLSKIKISDNFKPDDFDSESSIDNTISKINSDLLGNHPGQLDLSITRFFVNRTGPKSIYDFITGGTEEEITSLINSGFDITDIGGSILDSAFQPDTFATRIFIDDSENCDIEINPAKSDFFVYHNTTGNKTKGMVIGDYKLNQDKDGNITSDPMETPFFENDSDTQAF